MSEQDAEIESASTSPKFHVMPINEVLETLNVDPNTGLSSEEARERLEIYGPNAIPKVKGSFWKVYLAPILNWLINIYLLSSFALLILAALFPSDQNQVAQATFWLSIVAVNCLVAIFQQFRAQKKLEALEKLSAGEARVIREGAETKIPPTDIVPGDLVKLEQGDRIPADARIITESNLSTNEASLTGESVPTDKDPKLKSAADAALVDQKNMVFFGTYVATGNAKVVATTTGANTEIGKIQGELEQLNTGDIPLRKKVNRLAMFLGIAAVILMAFSFFWLFIKGTDLVKSLNDSITQAMAIMPINIPLLTTIVLLTGVLAMARKGVIIRDLSAVESLGRVSVICSDKTGTMTRNQMTVKFCWDTENLYRITGAGYEPKGEFYRLKDHSILEDGSIGDEILVTDVFGWKTLYRLVTCGGIDNDSEIIRKEIPDQGVIWVPLGDPTDAALLTLFRKSKLDEEKLRKKYEVVKEYPFESDLKRMAKVCKDGKKYISFVKGATEVLLPRCILVDKGKKPVKLDADAITDIRKHTDGFASKGYRVISLAYKNMDNLPEGDTARDDVETDLIYLGFVCIVDPPRDGVKEAVNACHSASISVVMITGDASATAKTIANDLNILQSNSKVHEGGNIQSITDEDFPNTHVYARVNPEHKQVIVERYQAQKKVVAMTGDGVNDALALAMSDAGIAMGITGTDVAKEAADLVITDDSFASIVTGVHQGRGLFSKIRMMIFFYVAINLMESILFFGAFIVVPLLGFSTPPLLPLLSNWQSLYLVATTHSFPGLALVFDKTSPRAMEEKPRDSEEIITRGLAAYMAINVGLMLLGAAILYYISLTGIIPVFNENLTGFYGDTFIRNGDVQPITAAKAAVMVLSYILITESMLSLSIRRINLPLNESLKEPGTNIFTALIGLICFAHILLMYVPIVQDILGNLNLDFFFMPLTILDWVICILFSLPAILGMEIYKRRLKHKGITL
jgi:Ca2+-transporting ATPase